MTFPPASNQVATSTTSRHSDLGPLSRRGHVRCAAEVIRRTSSFLELLLAFLLPIGVGGYSDNIAQLLAQHSSAVTNQGRGLGQYSTQQVTQATNQGNSTNLNFQQYSTSDANYGESTSQYCVQYVPSDTSHGGGLPHFTKLCSMGVGNQERSTTKMMNHNQGMLQLSTRKKTSNSNSNRGVVYPMSRSTTSVASATQQPDHRGTVVTQLFQHPTTYNHNPRKVTCPVMPQMQSNTRTSNLTAYGQNEASFRQMTSGCSSTRTLPPYRWPANGDTNSATLLSSDPNLSLGYPVEYNLGYTFASTSQAGSSMYCASTQPYQQSSTMQSTLHFDGWRPTSRSKRPSRNTRVLQHSVERAVPATTNQVTPTWTEDMHKDLYELIRDTSMTDREAQELLHYLSGYILSDSFVEQLRVLVTETT